MKDETHLGANSFRKASWLFDGVSPWAAPPAAEGPLDGVYDGAGSPDDSWSTRCYVKA